jgi:hypothetical protein
VRQIAQPRYTRGTRPPGAARELPLPLELTFALPGLLVPATADYINDCCWGGDVVIARLLPVLSPRYRHLDSGQEDWGWYVWLTEGDLRLQFDVFCDSPAQAAFRAHLVSLRRRRLLPDIVVDLPPLDDLAALVVPVLESWSGRPCPPVHVPAAGYR